MLVDLPNHLGSHMASRITHMSVEIGENVFVLPIREKDVAGGVAQGECVEGVFDGLEAVEDMEKSSLQVLPPCFFGRAGEEKRSHCTRQIGVRDNGRC